MNYVHMKKEITTVNKSPPYKNYIHSATNTERREVDNYPAP